MTNHTDTHSLYVLIVSLAYRWFSIPSRLHTQLLVWSPSFSNALMRGARSLGHSFQPEDSQLAPVLLDKQECPALALSLHSFPA